MKYKGIVTASSVTLPCPVLQTGVVYYKIQIRVYNMTIYETSMREIKHTISWDETIARRGGKEIGSCLLKWLNESPNDVNEVRLRSSSCGGQNRNHFIVAILMYVCRSQAIYNRKLTPYMLPLENVRNLLVLRDNNATVRTIHRKNKINVAEMQGTSRLKYLRYA